MEGGFREESEEGLMMQPRDIVERIQRDFIGVTSKTSWGETSLFYNPDHILPNGIYFCTLKEHDGENDKASKLNRIDVFRMSIGISKTAYQDRFGTRPKRPNKGDIIDTEHDFTKLDTLMPHPIYGWMSWVQILNPSTESFETLLPLLNEAYINAIIKFDKRVAKIKTTQ